MTLENKGNNNELIQKKGEIKKKRNNKANLYTFAKIKKIFFGF